MESYPGDPENRRAVLLDELKFVAAGLFEHNDFFARNFIVHIASFKHKAVAVFAVGGADEFEFG